MQSSEECRIGGHFWRCGKYCLALGTRTLIMGVINVTPDSFSDGGRFFDLQKAIAQGQKLIEEGADLLDIGGESSRPGSQPVSEETEKQRVLPVIEALVDCGVPLSVDTWKSGVADAACAMGASIINDITAFRGDPDMPKIAARHGCGVVLMHLRGTPATMQSLTDYADVIGEIHDFLQASVEIAKQAGVRADGIAVDPGIGFGKTPDQNILILRELQQFRDLGCPLLVGTSRKSFLGHYTGQPVDERLPATAGSVACVIARGADIVRVHDVAAMRDVARIADLIVRDDTDIAP